MKRKGRKMEKTTKHTYFWTKALQNYVELCWSMLNYVELECWNDLCKSATIWASFGCACKGIFFGLSLLLCHKHHAQETCSRQRQQNCCLANILFQLEPLCKLGSVPDRSSASRALTDWKLCCILSHKSTWTWAFLRLVLTLHYSQ